MAGFLYFIEQHKGPADKLDEWGISHAFDGTPTSVYLSQSPYGPGSLLHDETLKPFTPVFRPDDQVWKLIKPGVWLGYYKQGKPKPEDLQKSRIIPGYLIPLADGNQWRVPLVREYLHEQKPSTQLPRKMDFNGDGWTEGEILEAYQYLTRIVEPFFDRWYEAFREHDFDPEANFLVWDDNPCAEAVQILSCNYRLGNHEAAALGLFTTNQNAALVLCQAADMIAAHEALKKKAEPIGQDTDGGDVVLQETTPQL